MSNQAAEPKKKQKEFLETCALLFILTCIVAALTWVIPAGEFEFQELNGRNVVVPGTYHVIERHGQTPWDILTATIKGFQNNNALIFMTLFAGAAIYILQQTKSIDVVFNRFVNRKGVKDPVIIFCVMLFLTIGGATGVFANPAVALLPVGAMISTRMGLDRAAGVFMVYLGCFSGFNVGWASSGLQVAHPIAELPIFSGMPVRVFIHTCNFILIYLFVCRYFKMIRRDPTSSLNYAPGMEVSQYMGMGAMGGEGAQEENREVAAKDIVNLLAAVGAIILIIFGALKLKWAFTEFTAVFLLLSIFLGLYNGYGINGTTRMFIAGCGTMVGAAFVIGFATALGVVLENGKILHTVVYYLSIPITKVGAVVGASVMYFANLVINLFIPSGSGQAAAVMPIMIPIADLAGITRQVAVQAYQFGDGFTNDIVPTAPVLMAMLGIAGVSWKKWAKFYLPVLMIQAVFAVVMLTILQTAGWTGL